MDSMNRLSNMVAMLTNKVSQQQATGAGGGAGGGGGAEAAVGNVYNMNDTKYRDKALA